MSCYLRLFVLPTILFDNLSSIQATDWTSIDHPLLRPDHLTIYRFQMTDGHESSIAYFISLTRCQRDDAIEFLQKHNWRLDHSLNLFFEHEHKQPRSTIHSKRIDAPFQQYGEKSNARAFDLVPLLPRSLPKTIIIPTMIEFQRFIETFDTDAITLLENASKMMNLAMKYATYKQSNIPLNQMEHWKIHLQVDYTRLQTLLDNDMCAPLVWIEHFEHLLNGKICQLFDCDYMFNIVDHTTTTNSLS